MNPSIFVSVATEPDVINADRETIRYDKFVATLLKPLPENLSACHIAMGLAGELGELHEVNCDEIEEFGDYEFYLQSALNHYGLTLSDCLKGTIAENKYDDTTFIYWTGQLIDCVKREYIYNKPRELERIKQAITHIHVYIEDNYNDMEITRQEVLQANATKLEKRYAGLVYSDLAAQTRSDKA